MTDERRQIERAAARHIWRVRDQLTPSGRGTWAEWFQRRFGRTLDEAAKDFAKDRA